MITTAYAAVVDQQAGREGGEGNSLSGGTMLVVAIVFLAVIVGLAQLAQKKSWVMPALFVGILVVWPVLSMLFR